MSDTKKLRLVGSDKESATYNEVWRQGVISSLQHSARFVEEDPSMADVNGIAIVMTHQSGAVSVFSTAANEHQLIGGLETLKYEIITNENDNEED